MEIEPILHPVQEVHPVLFTVYQPTSLIKSKGRENLTLTQWKVYNEILSENHKREPERLKYNVECKLVTQNKNYLKMIDEIRESLQQTSFLLPRKYNYLLEVDESKDVSITPFPTIVFDKKLKCFEVEVHSAFKKILLNDRSFSKGDIGTLRSIKHLGSNFFYWQIRQKQVFAKTWEIEFEKLRDELGFQKKYKEFKEFKRWVLEPAKEELKDTWCAFDYILLTKGKGGKIDKIKLIFEKGPEDEAGGIQIGKDPRFPWEEPLLKAGMFKQQLQMIRHHLKVGTETVLENGKKIIWDKDYVKVSLIQGERQYTRTKSDIPNPGAYFWTGLKEGWWNEFVEAERNKMREEVQISLF